jgi:hypothetical protein
MYPIHCPVTSAGGTAINMLGPGLSFSSALNNFANQTSELTVPLINAEWSHVSPMALRTVVPAELFKSMRRLNDEAESLATRFRDLQQRVERTSGAPKEVTGRSPTLPSFQLDDDERLREMISSFHLRSPSRSTVSTRSRWYLLVGPRKSGNAFVNQDGRAIHIHQLLPHGMILGYGWHHSSMHYIEFSETRTSTGFAIASRSIAVFTSEPALRANLGVPWFTHQVQDMLEFTSPSDSTVHVIGQDKKGQPLHQTGSGASATFLAQASRALNFGAPFTVETEKLIDGTRKPNLAQVNPAVPNGTIRYDIETNDNRLLKNFYRPSGSTTSGEENIPDEVRKRLRFTSTPSSPSNRTP